LKATEQDGIPQSRKKSTIRAFLDNFLVELPTPKSAIFFVAFLQQFADPAGAFPVWLQFLILGVVVNIAFASADSGAVFFTSLVMEKMKHTGPYRKLTQWFAGSLMTILGIRLALSNE
jgi:threonine/homoserine/homoserine lactone efflux protein